MKESAGRFLPLVFALTATVSACVTPSASESPASERLANSAAPSDRLEVGTITDEDLRETIYKAVEERLNKTVATSDRSEEATEVGDYDSFRFTITKLTHGRDDVSADPSVRPDGIDVEVSGWYKRTVSGDDQDKPACTSFDARLSLIQQEGKWRFPDSQPLTFSREDAEDCY